jgi:hypothetical protein
MPKAWFSTFCEKPNYRVSLMGCSPALSHIFCHRIFKCWGKKLQNDPLAIALFVVLHLMLLVFILPGFLGLFRELRFYMGNNWKMGLESGYNIFQQDRYVKMFSFLPVGVIELLFHSTRIAMLLTVVEAYISSGRA